MSITRKVEIDGQEVLFKASAAIPRIYRLKFQSQVLITGFVFVDWPAVSCYTGGK